MIVFNLTHIVQYFLQQNINLSHSVPVSAVCDMEIVSLNKVQHHVHDMCLTYMENFYQPHTKITNLNILQMREDIS